MSLSFQTPWAPDAKEEPEAKHVSLDTTHRVDMGVNDVANTFLASMATRGGAAKLGLAAMAALALLVAVVCGTASGSTVLVFRFFFFVISLVWLVLAVVGIGQVIHRGLRKKDNARGIAVVLGFACVIRGYHHPRGQSSFSAQGCPSFLANGFASTPTSTQTDTHTPTPPTLGIPTSSSRMLVQRS